MTYYREGQTAKRNSTGEHVQIVEVIPVGDTIFYRIEHENGDLGLVQAKMLRPVVQSIARQERAA